MDRLDKVSILLIAVLVGASVWVMLGHPSGSKQNKARSESAPEAENPASLAELDGKRNLIRNLLEGGNVAAAEPVARELAAKFPYTGEPHLLLGDLLMRKQDPIGAMHEYKLAIDFNPDYLDKKTPLFQGKKLKVAVAEALAEIEKQLQRDPDSDSLKQEKKTAYYLYRKIAGSCG